MAADSDTHPPADVLRNFGLGKITDDSSSTILGHLEKCDACRQQVASLSGDSFLDRLRAAQGRSATPMPDKPAGELPRKSLQPPATANIPGLPPELASHPQYEILKELGRGGMGVVYLARNRQMDRMEVLKVMGQEFLAKEGARQRFEREIRSAARLNHPNVVVAYSVLSLESLLVFAMEYVEGEDLSRVVNDRGPLPVANACYCAYQVALGLQHAHEKQMVHRDIKPQNLILTRAGKKHAVKILDFGLAKANSEKEQQHNLTGEGKMLGTPHYMAPEQIDDASTADIRADIYSLGCTLYCLLSGDAPFTGGSLFAILHAHHTLEAAPLTEVRPEVPEGLAAVVRKMMAKDPARRYQTPDEVAQALIPFIKAKATPAAAGQTGVPVAASTNVSNSLVDAPPPRPAAERAKKKPARRLAAERAKRKRLAIGIGVAAALVVVLIGLWASGIFSVKVQTKDGVIVLENLPADADVQVDGEKVTLKLAGDGKTIEVRVSPGKHELAIKMPGFTMKTKEVTIAAGERQPVGIRLEPIVAAEKTGLPPVAAGDASAGGALPKTFTNRHGVIALENVPPDAEVRVDDRKVSVTLAGDGKTIEVQIAPGKHELDIRMPGFRIVTKEVTIAAGERQPIGIRLEPIVAPGKTGLPPVAAGDASADGALPKTFTNRLGMEFVLIPKGRSWLGGGGGQPGDKEVVFDQDFYLAKYEVTQEEWQKVTWLTPSHFSRTGGGKDAVKNIADAELKLFPVENVSWDDAQAFLARLNKGEKEAGWVYRLPTEAQWEYACRGGPLSDRFESAFDFYLEKPTYELSPTQANFLEQGKGLKRTCKVGSYRPNRLGLYDMHGNVAEWCDDPEKAADGASRRALRGGSWHNDSAGCRLWGRYAHPTSRRDGGLGLRVARVPTGKQDVRAPGADIDRGAADDKGFTQLFNGKDLTGWKTHPADKAKWTVKYGLLVGSGPAGYLFSVRGDYKNFVCRVEAMINDKGNSGQFFRTKFGPGIPYGYEAQIDSTHGDPIRTGSLYPADRFGYSDDEKKQMIVLEQLHKPDEWFTQEVTAIGNHILIKVNGKTTVDFVDEKNRHATGHFALQQHDPGTVVKFRKIEVKELPD
jgi:serine/threonine protein kinase/formylglycine-generating enzyme required for sulfatase activity